MLSSLRVTAQNLLDNMTLYKAGYYDIDNSTNFKLSEEAIREFRTKSSTNYSDTESYTGKIQGAVSGISDISGVGTPSSNGVLELHEQLDQELLNFITTIQNQESSTVTALENSVDLLISSLNSCIAKVGLNQGAIASYESNSFYTDKDVYTLANISQVFYQQHEDNKDVYEAMLEAEQNLKDAVQERKTQGYLEDGWRSRVSCSRRGMHNRSWRSSVAGCCNGRRHRWNWNYHFWNCRFRRGSLGYLLWKYGRY